MDHASTQDRGERRLATMAIACVLGDGAQHATVRVLREAARDDAGLLARAHVNCLVREEPAQDVRRRAADLLLRARASVG